MSARRTLMISGRFDGGATEAFIRRVATLLRDLGSPVYIVDADVGMEFGPMTMEGLAFSFAMVAFVSCNPPYGEKTASPYCTYYELKYAREHEMPIIAVQMGDDFPPGTGERSGSAQNQFVLTCDLVRIDARQKPEDELAEEIHRAACRIQGRLRQSSSSRPSTSSQPPPPESPRQERVRSAVAEFLDEHGASISSAPNTSMTSGPQGGHQDQAGAGTWQKLPDMPIRKWSLAAVASEGYVYVLGGFNAGPLADALRFDPSAGGWEALAPLPSARVGLAAAALGGKVYALGGWDGGLLADALRFDPSAGGWEALAPMPSGRFRLAAAALGGKVYALGGFDGGHDLADALRFDPSAGGWEALAPLPSARRYFAAAALGGKVYALGGLAGGGNALATVERFDPEAMA